jgi:hypothetical protein
MMKALSGWVRCAIRMRIGPSKDVERFERVAETLIGALKRFDAAVKGSSDQSRFARSAVEESGERGPCRKVNAGGAAVARQASWLSSRR